jgi:hypothetical protein
VFGFVRLKEGRYTTAQIDASWGVALWQDFLDWFGKDDAAAEYRHLTWEQELAEAREREGNGPANDVRL